MHFSALTWTVLTTWAALAARASADSSTTTVSVFAAGTSQVPITDLVASVISADATATTYAVTCGATDDCDLTAPFTFTDGPSTFEASYVASTASDGLQVTLTISQTCKITGTTSAAVCSISEGAEAAFEGEHSSTSTTTVTTATGSEIYYDVMTVTAGLDKLASATATGSGNAAGPMVTPFLGGAAAAAAGMAAMALL